MASRRRPAESRATPNAAPTRAPRFREMSGGAGSGASRSSRDHAQWRAVSAKAYPTATRGIPTKTVVGTSSQRSTLARCSSQAATESRHPKGRTPTGSLRPGCRSTRHRAGSSVGPDAGARRYQAAAHTARRGSPRRVRFPGRAATRAARSLGHARRGRRRPSETRRARPAASRPRPGPCVAGVAREPPGAWRPGGPRPTSRSGGRRRGRSPSGSSGAARGSASSRARSSR